MRVPVIFLSMLCALPAAAAAQSTGAVSFSFPDDRSAVTAPSGRWAVNYNRPNDDTPLRLSVQDAEGSEVAGFDFERTVDGAWDPTSDHLYVNDATASNSGDCLILTEQDGKQTFASLSAALNATDSVPQEFAWIKPAQLAADAHYYLSCKKWDDAKVDLTITGHTDAENGEFKYFMQYDLATRAFTFVPGTEEPATGSSTEKPRAD